MNAELESVTHIYAFLVHFYGPVMIKGSVQMCITIAAVDWPLGNWQYYFLAVAHSKQGYYYPVSNAYGD